MALPDAHEAEATELLSAIEEAREQRALADLLLRGWSSMALVCLFGGGAAVLSAEAVFTPADRSALQTALFGCVGACNDVRGYGDETYCYYRLTYNDDGPWKSGTGAGCDAGSTHGAIDTWDVSRVTTMEYSECIVYCVSGIVSFLPAVLPLCLIF